MGLLLCGLGGVIVFCELGCALVADGAGETQLLLLALIFFALFFLHFCLGFGVMMELGHVLTRGFTGSFVCRLERRVGAVLGKQLQGTGDFLFLLFVA